MFNTIFCGGDAVSLYRSMILYSPRKLVDFFVENVPQRALWDIFHAFCIRRTKTLPNIVAFSRFNSGNVGLNGIIHFASRSANLMLTSPGIVD